MQTKFETTVSILEYISIERKKKKLPNVCNYRTNEVKCN